ncbi:sugar transferase [Actinomycetota bacterium]
MRRLRKLNARGFRLIMVLDAIVLVTVPALIMLVRFGRYWPTFPFGAYLVSFVVAWVVSQLTLYFGGLYEREPRLGSAPMFPRIVRQMLLAGGMIALLNLLLTGAARELGYVTGRALPFPVLNLVAYIPIAALALTANRMLANHLRTRRMGPLRIVMAGDPADLEPAMLSMKAAGSELRVVEVVDSPGEVLGAVARTAATDVMVVTPSWLGRLFPDTIDELVDDNVTCLLRVTGQEVTYGLAGIREIAGMPFVLTRTQEMPGYQLRLKRAFDLLMLALAAPVWVLALLLVTLYQWRVAGSPLFYRQERVGLGGKVFTMYKFRTMRTDAESDGKGARLAEKSDSRIIPGCHWVRETRADELPQLWNVLKGEMSLVGPRPERPELVARFEERIPGYARRHGVPPGLTGLAQIEGRYHTHPEYKLGYDLQYAVDWSSLLDLQILLRTVAVVLLRRL